MKLASFKGNFINIYLHLAVAQIREKFQHTLNIKKATFSDMREKVMGAGEGAVRIKQTE